MVKNFLASAVIVSMAMLGYASPAYSAESYTLDGGDERLTVRVITSDVTAGVASWNRNGGVAGVRSGPVSQVVIYKGNIPITDDRFVQLLKWKRVGAGICANYDSAQSGRSIAGWSMLAGLGGIAYILLVPDKQRNDLNWYAVSASVTTIAAMFLATPPGRPYTTEMAVDACKEYNSR
ncbi:hypothetical protein D3C72_701800 [compost metagenome]